MYYFKIYYIFSSYYLMKIFFNNYTNLFELVIIDIFISYIGTYKYSYFYREKNANHEANFLIKKKMYNLYF